MDASTSASASAAGSDVAPPTPEDSPPRRAPRHRRAQSEILLGAAALPDDLAFDAADLGVVDDEDEYEDDEEGPGGGGGGGAGSRMFQMFLEAGGRLGEPVDPAAPYPPPPPMPARPRHQHSISMDGSTSFASAAALGGRAAADAKKAISDAKLAELALVDPKRAKRIMANRQSAARSKERKMRYIAELERKVQCLQTEATTLSAQLSMLQRDTTGLTNENGDLKLRVQTMEQQVRLQDALNDRLRDEVQQLKIATGQVNNANSGKMGKFGMSSYGVDSESYQRSQMQSLVAAQQLQQLQIRSQHQQPQMHLQQQHLGTVRQQHQHQLRQEALPFPGDLKMKGIAMTSHVQNAGAFGGHARNEP
ncbi:probable transcription factor PosF21 [Lolium perenne]|uniref:probable transcription factor PosF21 n=1 Tax=Lolium perenne TaxID=4522 RepID=UPI0021EA783A|nr:transcription factor RF2a-like [Lolium perenne]